VVGAMWVDALSSCCFNYELWRLWLHGRRCVGSIDGIVRCGEREVLGWGITTSEVWVSTTAGLGNSRSERRARAQRAIVSYRR